MVNIALSPGIVAGLLARNTYGTLKKIGSIVVITSKLPWKFSENKGYWLKTALRIADYIIALAMSPFYPFVMGAKMIANWIHPTSSVEPKLLNDRIDYVKNVFDATQIPAKDADNEKVIANRAFIGSLYKYSRRWGLISSSHPSSFNLLGSHSKGFHKTKKLLNRQRDDKVEEKYHLLNAFHELLNTPEKFEKTKEIVKFIEDNFTTPKQKAALQVFLKKDAGQIMDYSNIKSIERKVKIGTVDTIQKIPNPLRKKTRAALEVILDKCR